MEVLEQLGIALGLASLAGVNLYLTVLLAGLVIRFDLVQLSASYSTLDALAHPSVMAVAGCLFLLEFFADKIPWVDSLWDSVHTVIRPVGGTLLALQSLGDMPPYMEVAAALAAGSAALTTHSAKAGTRLLVNHSPEPVTNVAASIAEDVGVIGGMGLILFSPVLAFGVFLTLLIALWLIFPSLFRLIRSSLWLIWNKLRMPAKAEPSGQPEPLTASIPSDALALLAVKANAAEKDVAWTTEALTGRVKGHRSLNTNLKVLLIARHTGGPLLLFARKTFGDQLVAIPLDHAKLTLESRLLSDNLVIEDANRSVTLRFPRGRFSLVDTVRLRLQDMAATPGPNTPHPTSAARTEVPLEDELTPVPAA